MKKSLLLPLALAALLSACGAPDSTSEVSIDYENQLYDLSIITHDWQAEKYIQDLDAFTLLLAEATALLDTNSAADLSAPQ